MEPGSFSFWAVLLVLLPVVVEQYGELGAEQFASVLVRPF